jgi:uncharacterized protein YbjT (DUF2867 family)
VVHGSQAVFFATGVGFNAPVATLEAVDRDAAIRVFRAAEALGGRRVILISAYGTESGGPEGYNTGWWKHYYTAKHAAEQALMASTLPWTILRPGGLTDQPGTGQPTLQLVGEHQVRQNLRGSPQPGQYGQLPPGVVTLAMA